MTEQNCYSPFNFKAAKELASPRSWVAAFGPAVIAGALVIAMSIQPNNILPTLGLRSVLIWISMLICTVLMQSAVNTLNDYQDFNSGLDSAETILDQTDASIIYNKINPRHALYFAISCLVLAAIIGLVVVWQTDFVILALGIFAALIVVLYSGGPKPISCLPLGELVSGFVMGGIITVATVYAMTFWYGNLVLAVAVVPLISIAQIMQTNNTCDIERDTESGRRTLPSLIGLGRSSILNAALGWFCFVWMLVVLITQAWYLGVVIVLIGVLICYRFLRVLRVGPYDLLHRAKMMGNVTIFNRWLVAIWSLAILVGGFASVYFT
jgi:1,4-dihydroxy-2-naphthoate octaprenyltransferase